MVTELSKKFDLNVEIIRKSAMPFVRRRFVNTFPSIAINDTVVFKGQDVSFEELKGAIIQELGRTEHIP